MLGHMHDRLCQDRTCTTTFRDGGEPAAKSAVPCTEPVQQQLHAWPVQQAARPGAELPLKHLQLQAGGPPALGGGPDLMLMLALARAENMVAATPLRLAIWWPTAASTQQSEICSTLEMRPALIASPNLHRVTGVEGFA